MRINPILRRAAALALSLMLCLTVLGAQAAEKQNASLMSNFTNYYTATEEEISSQKYANAIAAIGDTLYIQTYEELYYWQPGMEKEAPTGLVFRVAEEDMKDETEPEPAAQTTETTEAQSSDQEYVTVEPEYNINKMFTDGTNLYLYDDTSKSVFKAVGEPGQMTMESYCTLKIPETQGEDQYYLDLASPCVAGDMMFAVVADYSGANTVYQMYRFDLKTGDCTVSAIKNIHSVSLYKQGQLLLKVYDDATMWNEDTREYAQPTVSVYDIATDTVIETVQTVGISSPYSFCGLQYQADTDTLYYSNGSSVMKTTGLVFPGTLTAYMPSDSYEGTSTALLQSGMYATGGNGNGGVIVRALDVADLSQGALTIYGDYTSNMHMLFVKNHPEIPLTSETEYYEDVEKLTNAMVSGEAPDVLRLDLSYSPVDRLIDKGYAMDLSGYPQIADMVKKMYPAISACVMRDDKVYGVPVQMNSYSLYVDNETWTELGLKDEDIPTNVMDLIDFVSNWEYDYADDNPDIRVFESTNLRETFLQNIMTLYIGYCHQQGQPLSFDTDLFRSLINKLEAAQLPEADIDPETATEDDWEEFWNKRAIFSWGGYSTTALTDYRYQKPHTLALTADTKPIVLTELAVMIINSKSTRVEQALTYLTEYIANNDDINFKYTVSPEYNEPLTNIRFESDLKNWTEQVDRLTKYLTTCEPSEKQDTEYTLKYFQKMIDEQDKYRYNISPEDIALYREQIAPYLTVPGRTPLNSWDKDGNNDLQTQMNQYNQKAITADQFIKEIDKRVRMMALEDQ